MKITLFQSVNGNKDTTLHIGVTSHPSYLKDRLVCETVEEAIERIKAWIERRLNDS